MLRLRLSLVFLALSLAAEGYRIGSIDFFGAAGFEVQKIRSVLPIHSGGSISQNQRSSIRNQVDVALTHTIGHGATDVAFVCCEDHGRLSIFIGLGGSNTKVIRFRVVPEGSTCLPADAIGLYKATLTALNSAIQRGKSGEDDSHGYALSEDPRSRAKQMAMREYAIAHKQLLLDTLQGCRSSEARQAAVEILGYGEKSSTQTDALVQATRDPDDGVRNNAIRALWVLATANPDMASEVPAGDFVDMLNSGLWTDRNKAGQLLLALTVRRDPYLLEHLAASALPSLIEMANWRDSEHAYAYRVVLGRVAGFDEKRIQALIANGNVDDIIFAAVKSHS